MGSSSSVQAPPTDLTCPDCIKLYDKPLLLKCGHTFCTSCLQKRQKPSTVYVKCPTCKKLNNVKLAKKENLTKKRLDLYNNSKSGKSVDNKTEDDKTSKIKASNGVIVSKSVENGKQKPSRSYVKKRGILKETNKTASCEFCNDENLKYWCKACKKLLCNDCKLQSKCSENVQHIVQILPLMKRDWDGHISQVQKLLTSKRKLLGSLQKDFDGRLAKILTMEESVINKINKSEEEYISFIKKYHDGLRNKFSKDITMHKRDIQEKRLEINKLNKKAMFDMLGTNQLSKNVRTLTDCSTIEITCEDINRRMRDVQKSSFVLASEFDTKFVPGKSWESATGPKINSSFSKHIVESSKKNTKLEEIKTSAKKVQTNFESISSAKSQKAQELSSIILIEHVPIHSKLYETKLEFYPQRIVQIDNEIWCVSQSKIYVYDLNGHYITEHSHERLRNCRSLTYSPETDIIYANSDNGGLIEADKTCVMKSVVSEGSFSDVGVSDGIVYALEYENQQICSFQKQENGTWMQTNKFLVSYSTHGHNWDTILLRPDLIYVASWKGNKIAWYNYSGEFIGSYNKLNKPRLCCADDQNNIIAADWGNGCLKLGNAQVSGEWTKEKCEDTQSPFDAIICNGNLWVVQYWPFWYKLMKHQLYTKDK